MEASTSRIPIEIIARTHLVKQAADDVIEKFADSKNYRVSACDPGFGCALVWRVFADDASTKLPFKFDRGPRVLQRSNHNKITCPCAYFIATQRVCPHILAYNEGMFGKEDVHPRHTKQYFVDNVPDCSSFVGCTDRRPATAAFHPLPARNGDVDEHQQQQDDTSTASTAVNRPLHGHMYSLLNQKTRYVVEKWSHIPVAATKLMDILDQFDTDMGDVLSYRVPGAGSSKPTPSRGDWRS